MPTLPYGEWTSPITSELITRAAARPGEPRLDGADVWWQELRPEAAGQVQLVRRRPDGTTVDVLPDGFSARTRVHEYGGGAWTVADGRVVFANWADQRLHVLDEGSSDPHPITAEPPTPMADRYAGLTVVDDHVLCVRESHRGDAEAVNEVVAVPLDGGEPVVIVRGPDFVAGPRVSPDGRYLSWFEWDHPAMPWDGTRLCVAAWSSAPEEVDAAASRIVAGGADVAITQAFWAPDGRLHFCSDEGGWWNLWAWSLDAGIEQRTHLAAEIGEPHWVFGQRRYDFLGDGTVVLAARADGRDTAHLLATDDSVTDLDLPFTDLSWVVAADDRIVAVAASFTSESAVVDIGRDGSTTTLSWPRDLGLDDAWFSVPESITFTSAGGRTAHALHYPPTKPEHEAPADERPPLIVEIHGGPTASARPQLSLGVQYWTSRGFAVVDVNYGGSTGYGRPYRRLLDGAWGIVDVEDCIAAARHLADAGMVDPDRLCITGGSAGGFTTLAALCGSDVFAAGASHYGVADLEALATDTHKFESRYLDTLVGPYPEARDVYVERSPIHHVDRLSSPLVVFQGLEDEIVPPNQAEAIVAAVRAKGVPVAYVAFEGEQHGFRRAENIRAALDGELAFYGAVLGFTPSGELPELTIENLPGEG